MANTIRASKNTFQGGLVMDLSPDTTPNEVLTSALNATLVTFNGNELLLQNDMGNGRVETARLPEGYIPVGTCEFGDIIYIVSYNPLTNKSLIGCFPSPERNISSEEIGSTYQTLSSSDFQEMSGGSPTGELKTNSVKKIIYNKKLNPGDKFVIYDKNNDILNEPHITDIGNIGHVYGAFPKWLRIHVIAIEDSGKITYLDSSLRWYTDNNKDYFIRHSTGGNENKKPDIDAYRSLLSSGYSVYQSKISGKLALLIELEKITGFDCTYSIYGKPGAEGTYKYRDYRIFWNFNWTTDDPNINPKYVVLTKSEWSAKEDSKKGYWYGWNHYGDKQYVLNSSGTHMSLPQSKGWSVTIDSPIDTSSYNGFIHNYSYSRLLTNFLSTQSYIYGNSPLTKLNIYRTSQSGYPQLPQSGKYYINASRILYSQNGTEHTYTQRTGDGLYTEIGETSINDIIVNNYFQFPVYKRFADISVPYAQVIEVEVQDENGETRTVNKVLKPDTTNLVYNYEMTPAMPYGLLREYSIEGYIDFGKIGTGAIDLTAWRYFNGENVSNLTIGMNCYPEDNMGISGVVLEFYDNQGMAAAYHIEGKVSYSGQFTEMIPLNGSTNTYKMNAIDAMGETHYHCGIPASKGDLDLVKFADMSSPTSDIVAISEYEEGCYINDCGKLYSNMLYLVKIVVKYCPINALGEFDSADNTNYKTYYRWMWTNTMFNKHYHSVTDFDDVQLEVTLDCAANYELTNAYYFGQFDYVSEDTSPMTAAGDAYKYMSAAVDVVTNIGTVDSTVINPTGGNEGGDGGDPSGGGGYDPDIPVTQSYNAALSVFTIEFNLPVVSVNRNMIHFVLTKDGNTGPINDWSYSFNGNTISFVFPNIGQTYTMAPVVEAGAILLEGGGGNMLISDFSYGFTNGNAN